MDKKDGIEIINSENICFRRQKFILACLKPEQQLSALEVPYKINSKEFVISVNIFANTFNSWEMFFLTVRKMMFMVHPYTAGCYIFINKLYA